MYDCTTVALVGKMANGAHLGYFTGRLSAIGYRLSVSVGFDF